MAAFWYQQAARRGVSSAQYKLAQMFLYGKGVEQSSDEAYLWAQTAMAGNQAGADILVKTILADLAAEQQSELLARHARLKMLEASVLHVGR